MPYVSEMLNGIGWILSPPFLDFMNPIQNEPGWEHHQFHVLGPSVGKKKYNANSFISAIFNEISQNSLSQWYF